MLGVDAMKDFSYWKASSPHSINRNMLLIGMSANASTEDQNVAFEAGMHFFASKPLDVRLLSTLLRNKRTYQDLNEAIAVLRTFAMDSENTGDVYCTQRYNLRSPPSDSKQASVYGTQCTQFEVVSASASRLDNFNNDFRQHCAIMQVPEQSGSYTSSSHTFRDNSPISKSRKREDVIFYTFQRYLCWTHSSKISTT